MRRVKTMQRKALKHYDKMIEFAQKQNKRKMPMADEMVLLIDECWEGNFCSYCEVHNGAGCDGCPLDTETSIWGSANCCGGLWTKMDKAKTWKTWIKYAILVREYIREHGGKVNAKTRGTIQ